MSLGSVFRRNEVGLKSTSLVRFETGPIWNDNSSNSFKNDANLGNISYSSLRERCHTSDKGQAPTKGDRAEIISELFFPF